ncbi:BREX-1 system adenine-specific DNA-methyltransferase PglX [Kaistella anthropi]|nr:BREX-1 system adenine-specific DNA-methyltransferase PglX [Kaistella anthropi]
MINPTISFQVENIAVVPIVYPKQSELKEKIVETVQNNIEISKTEWDSLEDSWNFRQNELLLLKGQNLEETYDLYQQYWKNKFFQLHQNEEELNRQFIEIYGLQDELTPDVPLVEKTEKLTTKIRSKLTTSFGAN